MGILISAPHWISLDAICIKTPAHWNKTAAVWLPRKALQKSCVHTRWGWECGPSHRQLCLSSPLQLLSTLHNQVTSNRRSQAHTLWVRQQAHAGPVSPRSLPNVKLGEVTRARTRNLEMVAWSSSRCTPFLEVFWLSEGYSSSARGWIELSSFNSPWISPPWFFSPCMLRAPETCCRNEFYTSV